MHGMDADEELVYWRERAKRAEQDRGIPAVPATSLGDLRFDERTAPIHDVPVIASHHKIEQLLADRSLLASSVQALTADIETYKALVQKMRPVFDAAVAWRDVMLAGVHGYVNKYAEKVLKDAVHTATSSLIGVDQMLVHDKEER